MASGSTPVLQEILRALNSYMNNSSKASSECMPTPRVFISYSHDSESHRNFVLLLSDRLRRDGLDCQIDQYVNGFPPEGWQRWMETQVETADFVLLVCTPDYLRRFRGLETDGGRGVNFEGVVISQSLYDHYYRNTKFVPVLPEAGDMADVPLPLKGFGVFRVMAEYEGLYRYLTGQAAVVAPEVGERVTLDERIPSVPPKQHLQGGMFETKDSTFQIDRGTSGGSPALQKGERGGFSGMSDTMKAAWIGGAFVLIGAIIAGVFALMSGGTKGNCSPIISGEVSGNITANCDNGDGK